MEQLRGRLGVLQNMREDCMDAQTTVRTGAMPSMPMTAMSKDLVLGRLFFDVVVDDLQAVDAQVVLCWLCHPFLSCVGHAGSAVIAKHL